VKPINHDAPANKGYRLDVDPESRIAWDLWLKIEHLSSFLWHAYEYDFLTLAASDDDEDLNESSHSLQNNPPQDNLPF
jgi:hypothetical protein